MVERKISVLLAEDDTFLADIYKKKFEMEGMKVNVCDNGEKCLTEAQKKKPDIIILDILLPKLDGFTALERLKKNPDTKAIPVLLLTNLGQKEDVDRCMKLGAVGYVIKAHSLPQETVNRVKTILGHANV